MAQTQQQIEEHVRYLIDKIEELEKKGGQDAKIVDLVLGFGELLEKNGISRDDVSTEVIHFFKNVIGPPNPEWRTWEKSLYAILPRPTVSLKLRKAYDGTLTSKTAYIHEDVMTKLGLLDADDDNIIMIANESTGRVSVAKVLWLREADRHRKNIIRLSPMVFFNLKFGNLIGTKNLPKLGDTVMIKKAAKAVPADKITVRPICPPGESYPFGEYYLNKKCQGTPIYIGLSGHLLGLGLLDDRLIGVPMPGMDSGFAVFYITKITMREEDIAGYGGVVTVTPETSFEILPSEGTEDATTSTTAGYFSQD
jgi:hypothetical protein